MAQQWYIECEGQVQGPYSSQELRDRAAAGKLRPTDKVSNDGKKWAPASKIKNLTFADTVTQEPAATVVAAVGAIAAPSSVPAPAAPSNPRTPALSSASTPKAKPSQSAIETTESGHIPGYEMIGVLGKGACGIVFRAKQVKLDRVVALKMVLSDRKPTPAALARFDKEAVSLAKLQHPNIVSVYDCGLHDGQAFFAMELLEGEDLSARIDSQGPLDELTAWHITRQTAAALAHAAGLGIYHRDIKPANLFLTPPPTGYPLPPGVPLVKVTDFGLALTRQTGDESTDQRLTAAGVVLGTPAYMPPEQFKGSDIDHRADIYALGASVYHMLSGDTPFNGATIWEVMLKKWEPTPRLAEPISEESADLVATLMAAKPEDRVGTYRELLERIDALPCMIGTVVSSPSVRIPSVPITKTGPVPMLPATVRDEDETEEEGQEEEDPSPRSRRKQPPAKSKTKLYVFAVLGGLAIAGAAALAVNLMGGKPTDPIAKPGNTKKEFTTGDREDLFNRREIVGWNGPGWSTTEDSEKTTVLTGKGPVSRRFKPPANFRVILGVDPWEATSVEVVVASAENSTRQWSILLDRQKGASFGVRESETASFQALGGTIPVPPKDENAAQYGAVTYERAGGRIRAFYLDKPLGEIEDESLAKSAEVKVIAEGGAVRLDTAAFEELIEKK